MPATKGAALALPLPLPLALGGKKNEPPERGPVLVKENYKGERGSGNAGSVQRNVLAGLAVTTAE